VKLVATTRAPERPEEAAQALARAAGIVLAEARMRLAREPPALVARLEPERADALAAALREAGLSALSMDAAVPSDRDRLVARTVALGEAGATFTSRAGEAMEVGWPEVLAILRGARASLSRTERTERSKGLSIGRAIATGGVAWTRKTERTVRSSDESVQQVILVYARDGRAAILADRSETSGASAFSRLCRDGANRLPATDGQENCGQPVNLRGYAGYRPGGVEF